VEQWQEDLWREIILSTIAGHADQVSVEHLTGFDRPAASRYAATSPSLLKWFEGHNESRPKAEHVRPFNFLLSLQTKSVMRLAAEGSHTAGGPRTTMRQPRPAAPYDRDVVKAAAEAFDRKTGQRVSPNWLESLGRSLVRYHLHPEAKSWGGDYDSHGVLSRRHVFAEAVQPIGKEADKLDERETVGDDDATIEYNLSPEDRAKLISTIKAARKHLGLRQLSTAAKVSHHSVNDLMRGHKMPDRLVVTLSNTAHALIRRDEEEKAREKAVLEKLRQLVDENGRNRIAMELDTDPSNLTKMLVGRRRLNARMLAELEVYLRMQRGN
jgi:hypothetical protein